MLLERAAFVIALLAASLLLGCASPGSAPEEPPEPWLAWRAPLGREHPLSGRVFDAAERRFITPALALERAARADFVLLGERHDHPDHHRLQAWLIAGIARTGRRPAIAFEMIARDRADALAAARAEHPSDPDALATALDWAHSGWPDFALYRPVFAAALAAGLPILPADLSRPDLARIRRGGLAALPAAELERLAIDPPLSDALRQELADEVRSAHCGMAPEPMVAAMIELQRARDAALADALLAAPGAEGAVLIAGAGHVRRDRAVPLYLGRRAPRRSVLVVGFAEVPAGPTAAEDLEREAARAGPGFDLIWFTPRVDDEDPCEKFRDQLEKLRTQPGRSHGDAK